MSSTERISSGQFMLPLPCTGGTNLCRRVTAFGKDADVAMLLVLLCKLRHMFLQDSVNKQLRKKQFTGMKGLIVKCKKSVFPLREKYTLLCRSSIDSLVQAVSMTPTLVIIQSVISISLKPFLIINGSYYNQN